MESISNDTKMSSPRLLITFSNSATAELLAISFSHTILPPFAALVIVLITVHLLLDIRYVVGTALVPLCCELHEVLAAEAPVLEQLAEWRTRMRLVVLQWAHV